MLMAAVLVPLLILAFAASQGFASDADPLQDFCVADIARSAAIPINGFVCKNPNQVLPSDFRSTLLRESGNTNNSLGSNVTFAIAQTFPGLNTQGLTVARVDLGPKGVNPPHVHPRASELLFLVSGTLKVGFVTAAPNSSLFQQTLYAGDLFIFPRGLVHFQFNPDDKNPAVAITTMNSQNAGRSIVANALFHVTPPLPDQVLEKAFGIGHAEVDSLIHSVGTTAT